MASEEIFDSLQLESIILSMIQGGKRNFAVDLSALEYIYSDAMNKILAINRQVLDVNGRLALLGPQPEVRQILDRSGVNNFLKIYDTDADLTRSSEEIIKQTQSLSLDSIKALAQGQKPKSDFEDLRSEIGKVFEEPTSGDSPVAEQRQAFKPPLPPRRAEPVPPQPPSGFPPIPPARPGIAPSFGQTAPASQPFYGQPPAPIAQTQYQQQDAPQGFYPPPQQQQQRSQQFVPPARPQPSHDFRMPPPGQPSAQQTNAPQPFIPPAPVREQKQAAGGEYADFGAKARPAPKVDFEENVPVQPRPARQSETEMRRRELYEKESEKKKFPVGALIIVVLLLALAGTGFFLFQQGVLKFTKAESPVVSQPLSVETPNIRVEDDRLPAYPEDDTLLKEDLQEEKIQQPVTKREPAPSRKPQQYSSPAQRQRSAEPAPKPAAAVRPSAPAAPVEAQTTNQIAVTSLPPGAAIVIDGETVGVTPLTIPNPSAYGELTIEASKPGYQSQKKQTEYSGGVLKEHFVLEREAPPPATAMTAPAPEPAPVRRQEPAPVSRPAPTPPPAPASAPVPTPAPAPSASASGGDPGTIFIASIPPVADVYMDGVRIGKTNVEELKVTAGTHSMKFVKGPKEIVKDMTFQAGKNASQMVRIP